MNDTLLAKQGIDVLVESLGKVEAERFIAMLLSEPFDYTEWQRDLFPGMTGEDIHKMAMESSKDIPPGVTYKALHDSEAGRFHANDSESANYEFTFIAETCTECGKIISTKDINKETFTELIKEPKE